MKKENDERDVARTAMKRESLLVKFDLAKLRRMSMNPGDFLDLFLIHLGRDPTSLLCISHKSAKSD